MDWIIKNLCTLGPIGNKLPAPGTFGSIVGVLVFYILATFSAFQPQQIIIFFLILFAIGIPLCSRAEVLLSKTDPPEVIWDEFTAVPFVYLFCLDNLDSYIIITGFILFRFFDIVKPLGIRKIQNLSAGLGVMLDDLAAACCSASLLYLFKTFALSFGKYQF